MDINRLEKFILLLGSDQPGEVANAAGMLVKALKKDGKDLHALVAMLSGGRSSSSSMDSNVAASLARLQASLVSVTSERDKARQAVARGQQEIVELKRKVQVMENTIAMMQQQNYAPSQMSSNAQWQNAAQQQHNDAAQAYKDFNARFQNMYQAYDYTQNENYQRAEWCLAYGSEHHLLRTNDTEFLTSLVDRKATDLSYKQQSWLDDIYGRLKRVQASR